ncbi:Protein kinase domain-containing protein [Mycena venus]|uniref:non-specific serine/threonine protein kinase n=1 Tax=Mycena venus TaxID=2733690 RepID=A0A8H7CTT0_9AGAR|nr:Protein kinase domain-containing protein [Mycena venus]
MPTKYNMIIRLWAFAFLKLLESLCSASSTSTIALEHLKDFASYAYAFYSDLLQEPTFNSFKSDWLQSLGLLARFKADTANLLDPPSPTTCGTSRSPFLSRELKHEPSSVPPSIRNSKTASKHGSNPPVKPSLQDFQLGRTLGKGSYSTVKCATSRTGREYAIKIVNKKPLIRAQEVEMAFTERKALIRLRAHPGIVSLYYAFQDDWSLYFVIDLAIHGDIQSLVSGLGSLSTSCVRYYAAQLADAIQYMHSKNVIHGDLKLENLLLNDAFQIKITGFGTGKVLENAGQHTRSFVTDYLTWEKVKKVDYRFPDGFDEQAKDLVKQLLVRDPLKRLGAEHEGSENDRSGLKSHPFFAWIAWKSLWDDVAPPIQAGLVKNDQPLVEGEDQDWEDLGAEWDDEEDSDGLSWASDASSSL